jgi:hypothetical protein
LRTPDECGCRRFTGLVEVCKLRFLTVGPAKDEIGAVNVAKSKHSSLRRSMYRSDTTKSCRVCCLHGKETFQYMKRAFVFDVDKARRITADGRKPVELDRRDVMHAVDNAHIYIEHIPHVRLKHPGIIARVRVTGADGKVVEGDLLIDGHHRAAKCLQLGVPYLAYRLTAEETDATLKKRPDRVPASGKTSRSKQKTAAGRQTAAKSTGGNARVRRVAEKQRVAPRKGRRARQAK